MRGDDAHEARGALGIRGVAEFVEELGVVGGVIPVHTGITRRVHTRLAGQRIHHQAGVVGDCRKAGGRNRSLGLDDRVLHERGARLLGVLEVAELTQGHKSGPPAGPRSE